MTGQLSLFEARAPASPAPPPGLEPFRAFVAPLPGQPEPSGPLPMLARSTHVCEEEVARIAGVPAERVLCLPAQHWSDELMDLLDAANRRSEAEVRMLEELHAKILGCSVDELHQRTATEKAAEAAQKTQARAERPSKSGGRGRSTPVEEPSDIGKRRLDERQRELLRLVQVENNVAVYTGAEHIPDWGALKGVMTALGGKWKTKKGFQFAEDVDARELVRLALETGEILDPKAAEFFETSDELADELAAWVGPRPGQHVLEPSAGRGAIVRALRRRCPAVALTAIEPLPAHRELLLELRCGLGGADFAREWSAFTGEFDGVAMNPPFSKRQDIKHITWGVACLKPGGRLAAIASSGVLYRDDALARDFRALVSRHSGSITENPEGSFAHAGTMVRTVTVRLTKGEP